MLTNINPPERAVFGETSSGTYQTVKYDANANNLIPINPNDPNVLNNNKTLTDWQKGIEAIATLDGQKATAIAGMYNSIMFDVTKVIQDYLRPLINEPWHATVKYNISSYVFDNATGAIYKSLVADNLGNALTDITKWENTGANIQTYIKQIVQNTANIAASLQAQQRIILSYALPTRILYSAGGFIFDDYSGSAFTSGGQVTINSPQANTWYYIFGIYNPTTKEVRVEEFNSMSPTLPSGFTKKKLLGAVKTKPTVAQLFNFTQVGNQFLMKEEVLIFNSITTPNVTQTITGCLPLGKCTAKVGVNLGTSVAGYSNILIWGNLNVNPIPSDYGYSQFTVSTNNGFAANTNGDPTSNNQNLFIVSTWIAGGISRRLVGLISYTMHDI